jgi:predicted nuclease with RNAse H fold
MQLGFALFAAIKKCVPVYEVFPSASYTMLHDGSPVRIGVRLNGFARGPKDMLDAYVAAATVREYAQGRGCEVGGGDGLGEIILPRPLPKPIEGVLRWPNECDWQSSSAMSSASNMKSSTPIDNSQPV